MIAGLRGTLEILGGDWAIINAGGISFRVYMPTSSLSTIGTVGKEARVYTHLHVREDVMALYGFTTAEELRLFEILISASGIGPKMGLAMLSAMSVEQLTMAIASGNTVLLTTIPGIGKKTASRLVLELKDKVAAGWVATPFPLPGSENTDVLEALTSLGYSIAEASRAVASLPSSADLSLEEKIKLALQYLGGR